MTLSHVTSYPVASNFALTPCLLQKPLGDADLQVNQQEGRGCVGCGLGVSACRVGREVE